jgi:predicted Rossmann fold flavoprotein
MKIAIIGGGASGLMAAAAALESDDAEVVLFERNDALGKKVLITGGGRCNVTTAIDDIKEVLSRYPRGGKFLSSAMYKFPPKATRDFFESRGVPLKAEEDNRVFPISENGQDIVDVFRRILKSPRAEIRLNTVIDEITHDDTGFTVLPRGNSPQVKVDAVILATGGQAYRKTGSTGDGYAFAQSLGHSLTDLHPSLSFLKLREKWPAELSGLSLQRARISVAGEKRLSQLGPMVFTHHGFSGPAIFAMSALVAERKFDAGHPLMLKLDILPDRNPDELLEDIISQTLKAGRRNFINIAALYMPRRLAEVACLELGISAEKNSAEVSQKDLRRFRDWIKGAPLSAIGRGAGEEFVTAGGVPLEEIDPSTMESKICPGLYFCGEIMNVDGFTGGFNLQAAWATGYLAGTSVAVEHESVRA